MRQLSSLHRRRSNRQNKQTRQYHSRITPQSQTTSLSLRPNRSLNLSLNRSPSLSRKRSLYMNPNRSPSMNPRKSFRPNHHNRLQRQMSIQFQTHQSK